MDPTTICYMDLIQRNPVFGVFRHLRPNTSLCTHAVRSAPLSFAYLNVLYLNWQWANCQFSSLSMYLSKLDWISFCPKPWRQAFSRWGHWRSSHYAITHGRNKIVTFKGGHPMWLKWFLYHRELLLKERICSLWEQSLSLKRKSHFEEGCNWRVSLLD